MLSINNIASVLGKLSSHILQICVCAHVHVWQSVLALRWRLLLWHQALCMDHVRGQFFYACIYLIVHVLIMPLPLETKQVIGSLYYVGTEVQFETVPYPLGLTEEVRPAEWLHSAVADVPKNKSIKQNRYNLIFEVRLVVLFHFFTIPKVKH